MLTTSHKTSNLESLQKAPLLPILLLLCIVTASPSTLRAQTVSFQTSPLKSGESFAPAWVGRNYLYNADAESSDGRPIRYSLRVGWSGMTVDPESGIIRWTPSAEGSFNMEIRAELEDDPTIFASQNWTIVVTHPSDHPGCTPYEFWEPVQEGVYAPALSAATVDDDLYVLHQTGDSKLVRVPSLLNSDVGFDTHTERQRYELTRWDGTSLERIEGSDVYPYFDPKIYAVDGTLYLYHWPALLRWSGSAWELVDYTDYSVMMDAIEYRGMLTVAGSIQKTENGSASFHEVVKQWDGSAWQTIADSKSWQAEEGYASSYGGWLGALNDRLYIAPYGGGPPTNVFPLREIRGGRFANVIEEPLSRKYSNYTVDLFNHNDALVLALPEGLIAWDGASVSEIGIPDSAAQWQRAYTSFKGEIYTCLWKEVSRPDSVEAPTIEYQVWRRSSGEWLPVSGLRSYEQRKRPSDRAPGFFDFATYRGKLYGAGEFNSSCGTPLNNLAVLSSDSLTVPVSGSLFNDIDRNCVQGATEPGIPEALIEITPGPSFVRTDRSGYFSTRLPVGAYTLTPHLGHTWELHCANQARITLPDPLRPVRDIGIGAVSLPDVFDVRAGIASGASAQEETVIYTLTCTNNGSAPASGRLLFEYDPSLTFIQASVEPDAAPASRAEWTYSDLKPGERFRVTVTMELSGTSEISSCAFVEAVPAAGQPDLTPADNRGHFCIEAPRLAGSGDLMVIPNKELNGSPVPLDPQDTILTYIIRFRNTDAPVINAVTVIDSLDPSLLSIATVEPGPASHAYTFTISGSGVLTWELNDLGLLNADSGHSASDGYVAYSVRINRGLQPGTIITNRAALLFDYQNRLFTNQVTSIVGGAPTGYRDRREQPTADLRIRPNPVGTHGAVTVVLPHERNVQLTLVDALGRTVSTLADRTLRTGSHEFPFDTQQLTPGTYFIKLDDRIGTVVMRTMNILK